MISVSGAIPNRLCQESILDSMLLNIFVRSVGDDIKSLLAKFVDDAKIGRVINNERPDYCYRVS